MTNILHHLEVQPEFPKKDLTEVNAEFLSMMLANATLLSKWHRSSEKIHTIFIGTHEPLVRASNNLFPDFDRVRHINFGIKALEAITLLVGAMPARPDFALLEGNINGLIRPSNADGVREYFEEARDIFRDEMPRTAEVIAESSQRSVTSPDLAILGGAIARQFGIHNTLDT